MDDRPFWRGTTSWAIPILAASWLVRLLFLAILPDYAYSWDISSWQRVAATLSSGENPYESTTFLNWPPLWMVCIYWMSRFSELTSLELITVIRGTLITFESLLIVLTGLLIGRLSPLANVRQTLLFGLALNPIAVLVICQHGNFDVIATTFVMLFLLALVAASRSMDDVDWLVSCAMLGLAILTKTYPMVLAPLLMPGARTARWRIRLLGLALVAGPAAIGMAVIHALAPEAVWRNVLSYRSRPGTFGLSGLEDLLGWSFLGSISDGIGAVIAPLIVAGAVLAWRWKRPSAERFALLACLLLLAVPTLGPGFGAQYAAWFLAPLTATFSIGSQRFRRTVLLAYTVSAVTYFVLYGYAWDLGQFMTFLSGSPSERALAELLRTFRGQALISLPMFVTWVFLLAVGILEFLARSKDSEQLPLPRDCPARSDRYSDGGPGL